MRERWKKVSTKTLRKRIKPLKVVSAGMPIFLEQLKLYKKMFHENDEFTYKVYIRILEVMTSALNDPNVEDHIRRYAGSDISTLYEKILNYLDIMIQNAVRKHGKGMVAPPKPYECVISAPIKDLDLVVRHEVCLLAYNKKDNSIAYFNPIKEVYMELKIPKNDGSDEYYITITWLNKILTLVYWMTLALKPNTSLSSFVKELIDGGIIDAFIKNNIDLKLMLFTMEGFLEDIITHEDVKAKKIAIINIFRMDKKELMETIDLLVSTYGNDIIRKALFYQEELEQPELKFLGIDKLPVHIIIGYYLNKYYENLIEIPEKLIPVNIKPSISFYETLNDRDPSKLSERIIEQMEKDINKYVLYAVLDFDNIKVEIPLIEARVKSRDEYLKMAETREKLKQLYKWILDNGKIYYEKQYIYVITETDNCPLINAPLKKVIRHSIDIKKFFPLWVKFNNI